MTSALEDIKTIDLEEWLTLATAASPTKLKQGQSPNMQNVYVDEKPGSVITAPGFRMVGRIPSDLPVPFCINYFKTSSGTQTFVVSDNSTVWTTVDFQNFTSIITGLSASFQLRGKVIRDKLWLTNGSDAVRTFDGTTVSILDGTLGTPAVPRGRFIEYHDERVWLYNVSSARSAAYFSSLTDASANIITPDDVNAWDTTDNFLQISEGDADFGTGMIIYRGYLHLFKQYSIWRLIGYDEYTYSRVKTRSSTGTRFHESLQILDDVVHLIGIDGLYVFDGDVSLRISDIIDPATASQTAFGFNQLQQPNTNNQFWEVAETADWAAGNVPSNLVADNAITLQAADDSQSDFQAGVTQSNVDLVSNPGFLQLSHLSAGFSSTNLSFGQAASIVYPSGSGSVIGSPSFLTDNEFSNSCGHFGLATISVNPSSSTIPITRIIIRSFQMESGNRLYFRDSGGTLLTPSSVTGASYAINGDGSVTITDAITNPITSPRDIAFIFNGFTASQIQFRTGISNSVSTSRVLMTEFQIFASAFNTSGDFTSKSLDLGAAPAELGVLRATESLNGQSIQYFTQSSDDSVTWDAPAVLLGGGLSGGIINSIPRRYLRWGATLSSDSTTTPQIAAVYLPSLYISAIHNTGGNIFSWGPVESTPSPAGQTIRYYYRTGVSPVVVSAATWNLIVPSGVISDPVANQYVQFKIEVLGGDATHLPSIPSVTINWVVGTTGQPQTLQNVASVYWRNRYWLSAAGPGATENDTIIIRGKKTFQSPWMLKDWNILSFTRFFDALYGGSSLDGAIYQLDIGYSKDGAAMDSFFETGDFTFGGFTAGLIELVVEAERMGPWNLTIGFSIDGGRTFTDYNMDLTVSTFDTNYFKRINLNVTATRFRLRFRTNGVDTPFQVHRCSAFYKLEPERGSIRGDYRA